MRLALRALLFCICLLGRSAAAETLDRLIAGHGFDQSDVGFVVETLDGRRLVEHRADSPGLPASTLKLVTALGALDALGPRHRFATRLWLSGTIAADGRLDGDVVLEGGGDPLLDLDGLMALALALRGEGVRQVGGRLIIDDDALPRLPTINPRQPADAAYNAGIGALNLAFNQVDRRPLPGGGSLTMPPLVEREAAWSRAPVDAPASLPVRDPGMHAAHVFRGLAASLGIGLAVPERDARPAGAWPLAAIESPTLRAIVQAMLLYSNNQVAEIVGLAATGEASLQASALALAAPIRRDLPEVDWRGFAPTNHSGLDPAARATPSQLLAVLRLAEERHDVLSLLPAAAWSGSLATRFRHPDAALRIWAKTGSLDFATALVGYALPRTGEPLRLAVLISDATGRRQRDAVEVPSPAMRLAIDDFTSRARELRDALALRALDLEH